jgi:ubiquinone/menaquinone biosynthesis C-methylase UbiE
MTTVSAEYERYRSSDIMKKLAAYAHQKHYLEQTSSATLAEVAAWIKKSPLSHNAKILDAGCGCGAFSLAIAKELHHSVHGIDISTKLIEEAKKSAKELGLQNRCSFDVQDFSSLHHINSSVFDIILCVGSLYWGQPLSSTLAEWNRITKVGGDLILFLNLQNAALSSVETQAIGATQFIHTSSMKEELRNGGWTLEEWENQTSVYQQWLDRFCEGLKKNHKTILAEMGAEAAALLIERFNTYYLLAKNQKVQRIILRAKKKCIV